MFFLIEKAVNRASGIASTVYRNELVIRLPVSVSEEFGFVSMTKLTPNTRLPYY